MNGQTPTRTLVLVAGSGRSGTSLFSGILQRLGFHVPQPEVPVDQSNPKGFAESQWVVDFHTRLLADAGVQVADGRPAAWAATARVGLDPASERELRGWLEQQFRAARSLVVKDPRLSWFLPLWRRCAEQLGATPAVVTMLRHPAAVVDSKQRWYGGRQGEAARAAGWLNQTLFTERATRDGRRAFVAYDDLLEDWPRTIARVAETLDLAVVHDAPAHAIRRAHEFVDAGLSRSQPDWEGLEVPGTLRVQADDVWRLVSAIADGSAPAEVDQHLDAARAAYVAYYADAEAVTASSLAAVRVELRAARHQATPGRKLVALVPVGLKRKVPPHMRARLGRRRERGVNA